MSVFFQGGGGQGNKEYVWKRKDIDKKIQKDNYKQDKTRKKTTKATKNAKKITNREKQK